MARSPSKVPVIAVIGATGTGKSQLAVELACRLNGEVINSDAMQLYEGLPVITNKITREEMKGIPHHLLGTIALSEDAWTVTDFVKRALSVIHDVHARGKLPILVGGTHYYIQSLLFTEGLVDPTLQRHSDERHTSILDEPTETILAKLREVDPSIAERWHPNDRRKIQRSLEIWLQTKRPASQLYEEQRQRAQGAAPPPPDRQRFSALMLWVHAADEPLRSRLNARVHTMLARGLLAEVDALGRLLLESESQGRPVDRTRGIWASIGFKEFEVYQRAAAGISSSASDLDLARLKTQAIEQVQAHTRQYAKRQIRWIRIKLLNCLVDAKATECLYLLDGSDMSRWMEMVQLPALGVASRFLNDRPLPDPRGMSNAAAEILGSMNAYASSHRRNVWQRKTCEACGTVAVTGSHWEKHLQSRGHKMRQQKSRREPHDLESAKNLDMPKSQHHQTSR